MQNSVSDIPQDVLNRQIAILDAIPDIVVEVDNNKKYIWSNRIGLAFFGSDMIGHAADYYFEGEQDVYTKVDPLFKGTEDTVYLESWQRRSDGQKRLLAWWCHTLKDEHGGITGAISTARDITDQRNAEESLWKSQILLQNIIDLLPVRIFWKDLNLKYLGCNQVFARDAGKNTPSDLIGKDDFDMAWKNQAELYRSDDNKVITTRQAKLNYEEPQTTINGETTWLNTNKVPLIDKNGNVSGVVGTYLDVTDRKNNIEKLKKSETRLRNAQKVAHVGNWEIDLATNMIWGSEEAIRIYGLDPEVPEYPLNRVQEMVLPEFRPMMDQALKSLINGDHEYNVEFQLKRESDNNIRYIHSIAELIRNQDGKPVMIAGTIQDITDRKRYEIELSNKNADLEKLNKIMINRELRMVELKEKIKELEAKLNHV